MQARATDGRLGGLADRTPSIPLDHIMFNWLWNRGKRWKIQGWDTFAGESYPIAGSYATEEKAVEAARKYLKKLERLQPTATSGGQSGIQDEVYVVSPEGKSYRVLP